MKIHNEFVVNFFVSPHILNKKGVRWLFLEKKKQSMKLISGKIHPSPSDIALIKKKEEVLSFLEKIKRTIFL
ncbi:hypothetical protein C8K15_10110 [Paenisporosarcina sp. OV554]|mgnify:FL=1|jgi:hypothetical protein|nr:hypothetical protein C8K15_10110 [Paenisporosarcina sp. OV554]